VSIHPDQLLPLADELREIFRESGYTVDGVDARLGPLATAAMGRDDPVPALVAASGDDNLDVLIRLFLLARDEPASAASFLPPQVLDATGPGRVRAALDLRPHEDDWWIASDIERLHPPPADHVIGVGAASATLLAATLRRPIATALDVGTGSGVQALHLSRHAAHVTATDALPRAIDMARLSFALSGIEPSGVELLCGDLLAPVAGREFDLVVSNPPFVLAPPDGDALTYRDAPGGGAGLARLLLDASDALAPDGVAEVLTSWVVGDDGDWRSAPAAMVPDGFDALVLLRELLDPAEHVALWRDPDEPEEPATARSLRWLAHLAALGAEGIAYGLVVLRRTDEAARVRFFDLRGEATSPTALRIGGWLDRTRDHRDLKTLADQRLLVVTDAQLIEESSREPEGWQLKTRRVVSAQALPETVGVDPITAALLAGCDGRLPLSTVAELLGAAAEVDPAQVVRVAARLVETGHLTVAT
jgi:methylase of polypeptide subunit release factors